MAKRIALYSISASAAKYKKAIKPLISFNAEFYIRLLFQVVDSAEDCKENISNHSQVLQCRSCQYRKEIKHGEFETKNEKKIRYKLGSFTGMPDRCPVCNGFLILAGPFWSGNLHNMDFLKRVQFNVNSETYQYLKYHKRIDAIVSGMIEVR